MALKKPIKIGKYEVVGLLGRGGMGVVYKANDPFLGRSVAIKMMTTLDYVDNPDLLQRFFREAQSTGNLHHRNIVTVYELGDHEGSPYLVMEYLEGETLDAIIQSNRKVPLLDQINYIVEVCDGLTYAHQRSVVHRDIKPGNIMILKDSGVKIVDFGIAHIGNRTVTRTGQLLGSLPYMSPEQITGKQVDARTDIFSLGVVFYQLLTSHLPFEGETPAATLLKIMHERPRPLEEFASFPPEVEEILLRALAKDREERYHAAQDFAFDLVQIRGRIQQEIVEEYLNEAELMLAREELVKARERLAEVLKIDRHNTRAVELSRATQQRIQQQELGEQVRQLRSQAEEAFQKEQYSVALDLVQKAISLHATDSDLQRLRATVQDAKSRTEKQRESMKRAESAYQQGELDSAKQAIEEALSIAPDDVHAKSLHRMIERDWSQRAQRLQVLSLIEEARKEIASRNFTLAMEVLRKAEAIDPATPELRALIDAAQAAREQERRRKSLEAIKREIEGDLDKDDFQLALTRAEAALQEFPDDRGLLKLRDLAQKQRIFAERNYYIKEQLSRARKLLESGRTDEVVELLQTAREQVGTDPQLDSLMVVVRETLERQRLEARKLEYLRRAKDQLRLKQYSEAVQTLEAAKSELGDGPEIEDLLQFTQEQQIAEKRRQDADAAADKAQALVRDQDYDKAVEVLEAALAEAPDEELRIILVQARHAAADHRKHLEDALANTESMIQGQRPVEALRYLQSQPQSFSRDLRFVELLRKAKEQADRLQNIGQFLERARVQLARNEFDSARTAIEECIRLYGRTPDVNKLQTEIEERQTQVISENLEKALADSRALIHEGRPDQAIERLSAMREAAGKVPPKLNRAYLALQQEAANAQARKFKADIEQLLAAGALAEAAALLQRAQGAYPQNRDLQQVGKSIEQATQRRSDAEKLLDGARASFGKQAWHEGADLCLRIGPLSLRDPVVRKEALSTLEQAALTVVDRDWRNAEYLLQCMAQLQPNVAPPAAIQDKISSARQEESIQTSLEAANQWQAKADLTRALEAVAAGLAQHPSEPRLLEFQEKLRRARNEEEDRARREQERSAREKYVTEILQAAQREITPEGQIHLLEEALRKFPDAKSLQENLARARELQRKVNALTSEAQKSEESRNYDQAIRSWSELVQLGVAAAEAEGAIARLRRLREEARDAARTAWLRAIRDALTAFDINAASSLLEDAQREFPQDSELLEVAALRDKLLKGRQDSLKLLAKAQSELDAQHWQQALELVGRSLQGSGADPTILTAAQETLLRGCQSALPTDLASAEKFLDQATKIKDNVPEVAKLRAILERQAREEIVRARLADVKAVARSGDTERALSEIDSARSSFPDDPRFAVLKQELERDIESERIAQEKQNRLLGILEAAQNLRKAGDLSEALDRIQQGLREFPEHPQFLEMKRSVEIDIRSLKEQKKREEKERARDLAAQKKAEQQEEKKREQEEKLEKKRRLAAEATRKTLVTQAKLTEPDSRDKAPWLYVAIGVVVVAVAAPLTWKAMHRPATPPPATVAVQIDTMPQGAIVHSKESGQSCVTPRCTLDLAVGVHELQVEMPGYQPLTKSVTVDADAKNPIVLALAPVAGSSEEPGKSGPIAESARLDLRDAQPGAEVLVDQKRIGKISRQGKLSADVAPGSHRIELLARNQNAGLIQREFVGGRHVELSGSDFASHAQPPASDNSNSEQNEWQAVRDSQDIQAIDGFLKRHPSGAFAVQAQDRLENLQWAKATGTGTASGFNQYLEQFPNGKYSQQAHNEIAGLEWRALENSADPTALQSFLKKYPTGSDHDKAFARLDDLSWQRTNQNEASSLR
jgi:tetratricopeptide (TPR) repeat protein